MKALEQDALQNESAAARLRELFLQTWAWVREFWVRLEPIKTLTSFSDRPQSKALNIHKKNRDSETHPIASRCLGCGGEMGTLAGVRLDSHTIAARGPLAIQAQHVVDTVC